VQEAITAVADWALPSGGSHVFGRLVMRKTNPRRGRWKRLDSLERASDTSFPFTPMCRQLGVIAMPMLSPAVL